MSGYDPWEDEQGHNVFAPDRVKIGERPNLDSFSRYYPEVSYNDGPVTRLVALISSSWEHEISLRCRISEVLETLIEIRKQCVNSPQGARSSSPAHTLPPSNGIFLFLCCGIFC